jgi:bifunctional non-homologous end joining protein LigD
VAFLVRQALDALGLASFAKTSGALGLHLLVPIERRHTYDETRRFATQVAREIAGAHPDLATTEWSKARRRGVLIDASQNAKGKTIASVYSVRPRSAAPVSTPLRWDEVNTELDPATYTMDVVRRRLRRHGDLYADVLTTKQRLGPALRTVTS